MVIEESIEIYAPLTQVWQVFSALSDWQALEYRLPGLLYAFEGQEMALGTCFSFTLRPYYLPIKITPQITKCEAGREVVWEGKRLGIHAVHRFDFREVGDRVVVTSTEQFGGPLFFFSRLLFVPQKLHQMTKKLLADIKQAAEACVAPNDVTERAQNP
jgi:hypothetical protein